MEIYVNVAEIGRIKLTAYVDLGDLQLGRVGQKYILDPELREILSCAVLDAEKMIPYQDQELFLITSVVYSEKFELVGKRKQEVCTFSPPLLWICVCFDFHIIRLFPAKMVVVTWHFNSFPFPLVFSGKEKFVSNHHRSSQKF